jgi:tRNA pseudouridine38-40 synthase
LDRETLAKVCSLCCGRHDFTAFAASRGDGRESEPGYAVRTIWSVDCVWDGEFLTITFFGEGFLYKMVRLLVGAMLRVAQHRETIEWFADYLHQPNGRRTSYVAPAGGLYLVEVRYDPVTPP